MVKNTCAYCHADFESRGKRKYCSDACKYDAHGRFESQCEVCSKPFRPANRRQTGRWCSRECYDSVRVVVARCDYCGEEYRPKHYNRTSYCSRDCAFAHWAEESERKRAIGRIARIISLRTACDCCGGEFIASTTAQRICSDDCRMEWARRRSRKFAAQAHDADPFQCRECGKWHVPEYGDKRRAFCSHECMKINVSRTHKATRRARMLSRPYEPIDPIAVFGRDKWRCRLCGVTTPRRLRGTLDDRAPELDHIVPLALGGAHTIGNVQCACRKCNQAKGATVAGQLSLLDHHGGGRPQ